MSASLFIFTVLACFALLICIIVVSIVRKRSRSKLGQFSKDYSNSQIYVGNLPYHLGESDLRNYFSHFGTIEMIKLVRSFHTGHSKGYAFVTYATVKQAMKALDAHGKNLHGRSLVVRIAKSREQNV